MTVTRMVAFGGGHGLSAALRALRRCAPELDLDITAVVTVGDDGGSSGRLRAERGGLPPGDLRQALVALAGDHPSTRRSAGLFQHRFVEVSATGAVTSGVTGAGSSAPTGRSGCGGTVSADGGAPQRDGLGGHAVGNLVLCGLMELLGDPVAALDHAGAMLGAVGRVLPMSCRPVGIEARVRGADPARPGQVDTVTGQHQVAVTTGRVESLRLNPDAPEACPQALAAIEAADWLLFGPGSWYTSVLPHLLVPELAAAIVASPARRLVTLNLAAEKETSGLSVADHLAELRWYLPELKVDVVLGDAKAVGDPEPVERAAESLGARLVLAPVAVTDGTPRHDPTALGAALVPVLGAAR
ncbi:2-phospho-L-lactate transferase CofD family protein [Micromonospora sp. WMMA1363]|uniref:gluconeogenesis factor YvcK family protein n=1 Tax=Micromonospora sp. WMMA1363 TaxID=3053985 RepID=UPI00259CB3BF|nr:2-phospho-L-lactate transferase CofD family protein [Micromonospora sp. WMMA1363]MDM4719870.1 2-phospho-L-lactate transferase CofD family protein [Micromonospora sp. WMMA1363]